MHQYLNDTQIASRGIIDLIGNDGESLAALVTAQRITLGKEAQLDILFMQRQMQPHANYWYGLMVEAQHERMALDQQIQVLEAEILDKRHSLAALSGALLQIAKQGISSVRGKPDNCPKGRAVNGVDLRDIIWAARNQAQHYEEPKMINAQTVGVFERLSQDESGRSLTTPCGGISLAYNIIVLLGWLKHETYENDMQSLLG